MTKWSRPLRSLCSTLLLVVLACSNKPTEPDFPDPDVPGRDTNPDGVPYPIDHLGGTPRSGDRPGDRIPNFTFQGYVDGDRVAGLKTISLADYFDPTRKRHRLLHLEVAATWCPICSSYAAATTKVKVPLGEEGIVYLEVIVGGQTGTSGPSLQEVDDWIDRHKSNFTTAIDVRARRLGSIGVPLLTMPWDIIIDTRTMEIVESSGGAPKELVAYDRSFLRAVESRPPAY